MLRVFGARIGDNVLVRPSVRITYPWKVDIGTNSWVGDDVILYSLGNIRIGENSVISQKSYLCASSHNYKKAAFPIFADAINIGNEVWIAADVFVGPGVSISNGVVVGARSSVFQDIPEGMVCLGNPAVVVKRRLG